MVLSEITHFCSNKPISQTLKYKQKNTKMASLKTGLKQLPVMNFNLREIGLNEVCFLLPVKLISTTDQ